MSFVLSLLLIFAIAEEKVPVEFETTIETCISSELLWEQLQMSMVDSKETWLWPQRRSKVLGEGLEQDAIIEVTYRTTFSSPTYTYELKDVTEDSFRYSAVEGKHPFEGGATIALSLVGEKSSLRWTGLYLTDPSDWLERRFFKSYERNFFRDLKRNIKLAEKDFCN